MPDERKDRFVKAQVGTVQVTAPYAFVPMEPFTIPTPWGTEPRLDKPHREGISGEIIVRWTAESPILVGGAGENAASFFRLNPADEKSIALPGSTLRGAIRALLEAMTMARMEHVDRDAVYAVRDFSSVHNQVNRWQDTIRAFNIDGRRLTATLKAGFLRKDGTGWHLQPTQWIMLPTTDVLAHFGKSADLAAFEKHSVAEKFALLGNAALNPVEVEEDSNALRTVNNPLKTYHQARLVLSGIDPKAEKNKEALFFTESDDAEIAIGSADIDRFLFIHSRIGRGDTSKSPRGALDFWLDALKAENAPSIPVFWIDARKPVPGKPELPGGIILSLARSLKIPFSQSVGQVLDTQRKDANDEPALDYVQALFGHVPHDGTDAAPEPDRPRTAAWRGRVQFADAPVAAQSDWLPLQKAGVMGAPRPSFWPYYLTPDPAKPDAPADWSTHGANLAGFKRYPVRKTESPFGQALNGNERVATSMNFIEPKPQGLAFEGRIRVHNLLPQELGALIYALSFGPPGSNAEQRHAIGRGKPQGYGRMRAEIADATGLTRNIDGKPLDAAELTAAVTAFQDYVTQAYQAKGGTATSFADIPAVADTLALQTPAIGEAVKDRLTYPKAQSRNEGITTVAGYTAIKTAAKARNPEARLPRYPRK